MSRPPTGGGRGLTDAERTIPMNELIASAKDEPSSTINNLSMQDVSDVWWRVSQAVAANLVINKGTRVPELGTFTMVERRQSAAAPGKKKAYDPVFVLSASFAARHDLATRSRHVQGSVPVVSLGMARIAAMTGFDKGEIEGAIKEVVYALEDRVDEKEGIALEIAGVGKLTIRRNKAKFRFYSAFEEQPRVLFGRPPSSWGLSSRCKTAGTFGRGDFDPSTRAETPMTKNRLATPLLLPPPSYIEKSPYDPVNRAAKNPIKWQSSMGNTGFIGLMDPDADGGGSKVPNTTNSMTSPPHHLPPLTKDEEAQIARDAVRDLNGSIPKIPAPSGEDNAIDRASLWETDRPLSYLTGTQPNHKRTSGPHDFGSATIVEKSPRQEVATFDPYKTRPNDRALHAYIEFQRSQPTPDPGYKQRVAEQAAKEKQYLESLTQDQATKGHSIELALNKAKRAAAEKVATFNWKTGSTKRPTTATPADAPPQMYVLTQRPDTSHNELRTRRVRNAENVTKQINQVTSQRKTNQSQIMAIDRMVMDHNNSEHDREVKQKEAERREQQQSYRDYLDKQTKEGSECAKQTLKAETAAWWASVPFQAETADDEAIERSRTRKLEDSRANIHAVIAKQNLEDSMKIEEISQGRAMLNRAKETLVQELVDSAQETQRITEELRQAHIEADMEKKERDAFEAQYLKSGAPLTVLEQTDRYDHVALPTDGANFVGRPSHIQSGKFVKGTTLA